MTTELAGVLIAIIVAVIGWAETRMSMRERFAKLEVKVDTMWDFQLRRAEVEAINKGMASRNSPLLINPEAMKIFNGMTEELRSFYDGFGRKLTDAELALEIEKHFGARIAMEVCLPYKMTNGECLVIAVAVAKGENKVQVPGIPVAEALAKKLD